MLKQRKTTYWKQLLELYGIWNSGVNTLLVIVMTNQWMKQLSQFCLRLLDCIVSSWYFRSSSSKVKQSSSHFEVPASPDRVNTYNWEHMYLILLSGVSVLAGQRTDYFVRNKTITTGLTKSESSGAAPVDGLHRAISYVRQSTFGWT